MKEIKESCYKGTRMLFGNEKPDSIYRAMFSKENALIIE